MAGWCFKWVVVLESDFGLIRKLLCRNSSSNSDLGICRFSNLSSNFLIAAVVLVYFFLASDMWFSQVCSIIDEKNVKFERPPKPTMEQQDLLLLGIIVVRIVKVFNNIEND